MPRYEWRRLMADTTQLPTGWQCPLCKRVHAPQVLECYCTAREIRRAQALDSLVASEYDTDREEPIFFWP